MGDRGEDMQHRTRARFKPRSLRSGLSLYGMRSTRSATGAPHPGTLAWESDTLTAARLSCSMGTRGRSSTLKGGFSSPPGDRSSGGRGDRLAPRWLLVISKTLNFEASPSVYMFACVYACLCVWECAFAWMCVCVCLCQCVLPVPLHGRYRRRCMLV